MEILLANPRGFCAGVDRAIAIVEQALAQFGAPIYVRHEVVHNRFVVDDLKRKGAVFVEELDEVPRGATVVFSAHGVSKAVRAEAQDRGLTVFDATCPLVTKVHVEIAKMHDQGREIVMIGHRGHPEVEGTMGQCDGGVYLVESVADVATLKIRDPARLAYMVDAAQELRGEWIEGKRRIGLTAGASAPEVLVRAVIERLREMGAGRVHEISGVVETIVFPLPKGLTGSAGGKAPEVGPPA